MTPERLQEITGRYRQMRLAMVGDFCLDRYFEIDPARQEISLETGLPVHNITRVRCQPGGSGTVVNNLVALGVGEIYAVGLAGEDGEGWELRRALAAKPGVRLDHFIQDSACRTFTYTKPLVMEPGIPPRELNRLDIKNWDPTPVQVERRLVQAVDQLADTVDALILLEQVDQDGTGVITRDLLKRIGVLVQEKPQLTILADSRRGLAHFPPADFKMNGAELGRLLPTETPPSLPQTAQKAAELARKNQRRVFVTLAEHGIVGAGPDGQTDHVPAFPIRGPIDIVGAGDAVTANLTTALAAGASLREAMEIAMAAASIVVHQVGTTGTASVSQIAKLLFSE